MMSLQPPPPPPPPVTGCTALGLGPHSLTCQDVSLILAYIVLAPLLALFVRFTSLKARGEPAGFKRLLGLAAASQRQESGGGEWSEELLPAKSRGVDDEEEGEKLPRTLGTGLHYSAAEEWLRRWYRAQACSFYLSAYPVFLADSGGRHLKSHIIHVHTNICTKMQASRDGQT